MNGRGCDLFLFYRRPIMGAGQPLKGGLDMNRHTTFGSPYLLGFDHLKPTYRYAGRDFRLTDLAGNVVKDILA